MARKLGEFYSLCSGLLADPLDAIYPILPISGTACITQLFGPIWQGLKSLGNRRKQPNTLLLLFSFWVKCMLRSLLFPVLERSGANYSPHLGKETKQILGKSGVKWTSMKTVLIKYIYNEFYILKICTMLIRREGMRERMNMNILEHMCSQLPRE